MIAEVYLVFPLVAVAVIDVAHAIVAVSVAVAAKNHLRVPHH